jgi:hypothetical protein
VQVRAEVMAQALTPTLVRTVVVQRQVHAVIVVIMVFAQIVEMTVVAVAHRQSVAPASPAPLPPAPLSLVST